VLDEQVKAEAKARKEREEKVGRKY